MTWLEGNRFGDDAAKPVELDNSIEFTAKTGGAGGEENRILEALTEDVARQRSSGHCLVAPVVEEEETAAEPILRSYSRR